MADTIERTIYKLEIDDSGYIRGVESMSASTQKLIQQQNEANKKLIEGEAALRSLAEITKKNQQALDSFTGTDTRSRKILEDNLKASQIQQQKQAEFVAKTRIEYEKATKAAQDFAEISLRASQLPLQPGARIPIPPSTPVIPTQPPILSQLKTAVAQTAFSLGDLPDALKETIPEFEKLRTEITLAEQALAGFNEESEEFKQLKPVVEQGKIVLEQYDKALKEAGESTKSAGAATQSIRGQLRQAREELVRLEQAGKGATKEYFELEKRTARLTDAFNDQQQRIRILASDTKLLDFGKASITAATSAFQAYTAVSILVGDQSEELQKKTMQLFAAMQLLQSLEQLSNLTRREGVLATLAQSGAQSAYTAVVGASTGALKAFRIALAATGIGAVIVGITLLVTKFNELTDEQEEAAKKQKVLSDVLEQTSGEYQNAVKNVNELKINIQLAKEGFISKEQVVKQYNETIGKTTGEVTSLDQAERELIENADDYIRFTFLKAAANVALAEAAKKAFEVVQNQRKDDEEFLSSLQKKTTVENFTLLGITFGNEQARKAQAERLKKTAIDEGKKDQQTLEDIATDFQKQAAEIAKKRGFDFTGGKLDTKPTENEFAKRLKELQAKLAEVTAKSFESEGTIRKQFQASLEKEIAGINELLKDKKITEAQAKILIDLTVQINDVQLNEALDQFNKKVIDARKKLNDEINELQNKNILDSLNFIEDEFERRKALIDFNEQKELIAAQENSEERLAALNLERLLIGEQAYQDAKNKIIAEGELEANNIIRQANLDRQDLAADVFKKSLDNISNVLLQQLLNLDENTAGRIQNEKDQLAQGIINYDEYQKNITKILKEQKEERDRLRLRELNNELFLINQRIEKTTSLVEKEELQKRSIQIRSQIAEIKSQTNVIDPNTKRVETVQQYAEAIGQITDSIVSFWQKANEAEAAALQRSITLQEERVNAAQRITERGNAQYLKAETDRLKELQVARENAARRDLAINAALQSSQLLVGITGAISKIATPGIGIAETIGAIAVIVAALGTGYGLVKSLQGNQPRLFKGTPEVKREGQPAGIDTIPAWLTEGEAVIPQEKNKKYKKSVEAIYHGKIPAQVLNEFVENYVGKKSIEKKNILTAVFNKSDNEVTAKKNTEIINKLINERISKGSISSDIQKSLIDKNISLGEVKKYSELINKSVNETIFRNFVSNVSKTPAPILNKFIQTYSEIKNRITLKNLIEDYQNVQNISNELQKTNIKEVAPVISSEKLKTIINNYHTIKSIPQPDYQKIKEVAELKVTHDGNMAVALSEQNKLIQENNDLQRQTLRALKSMGVNVNIDKDGLALSVMEVAEQIKKDKRV